MTWACCSVTVQGPQVRMPPSICAGLASSERAANYTGVLQPVPVQHIQIQCYVCIYGVLHINYPIVTSTKKVLCRRRQLKLPQLLRSGQCKHQAQTKHEARAV